MNEKLMCKVCDEEGDCGGLIDKCANCWEVERRLADYLKSKAGRQFVVQALQKGVPGEPEDLGTVGGLIAALSKIPPHYAVDRHMAAGWGNIYIEEIRVDDKAQSVVLD